MNYQKLLEAKIKLAEIGATTAIIAASVILFTCAVLFMVGYIKGKTSDYESEITFHCFAIGGVLGLIGVVILGSGIYNLKTARLKAESNMANYNWVEIVK